MASVAKAAPDGHTLVMGGSAPTSIIRAALVAVAHGQCAGVEGAAPQGVAEPPCFRTKRFVCDLANLSTWRRARCPQSIFSPRSRTSLAHLA